MGTNARPHLYLTGGYATGWQDRVRRQLSRYYNVFDLRSYPSTGAHSAAVASATALDDADVVLAYLGKDEPDCHITFAELGSIADGTIIVLVDEWHDRRSEWLQSFVGPRKVFQTLDQAIEYLQTELDYYRGIQHTHELVRARGGGFVKTRAGTTRRKSSVSSGRAHSKQHTSSTDPGSAQTG